MKKTKALLFTALSFATLGIIAYSSLSNAKLTFTGAENAEFVKNLVLDSSNAPTTETTYQTEVVYNGVQYSTFTFKKVKAVAGKLCGLDADGSITKDEAKGLNSISATFTGALTVNTKFAAEGPITSFVLTSGVAKEICGNYVTIVATAETTIDSIAFNYSCINESVGLSRNLTGFNSLDWKALTLDSASEWGNPTEAEATYGLRKDLAAMKKWSWYTKAGKQDISTKANTQFIAWAASAPEINDGVAEQVFANKVTVAQKMFVFRCGTDSDSNVINVRMNVIDANGVVTTIQPAFATGAVAAANGYYTVNVNQWVYGAKLSYDFSAYLTQQVTIAIEIDQPADGNPTIWLDQMGFYPVQLSRAMGCFTATDLAALTLDTVTEWGNPAEVEATYGLRNDLVAMKKWSWYTKAGKQDISAKANTQFIAWAASAPEINDGVAEQVFANRVKPNKNNFVFRCGTDSDSNVINVRMNVINDSGLVTTIVPSIMTGAVAAANGWYTVNASQWVFGSKLTYDFSAYLNKEVVIAIEVEQPAEGNPTIWLDQMGFYGAAFSREMACFNGDLMDALPLDTSTEWGNPTEAEATYGLRKDLAAMKKWSWYTKAGKQDISAKDNTQFIAWAASAEEINDGVAEQVFANRVKPNQNNFVFRCGTDSDSNVINVRMNVINNAGVVTTINPSAMTGAAAAANGWYTVNASQWVFGAKLTYDFSAYLNKEVVIAIEVEQPSAGNPTIWLDQMGFYAA